MVKSNNICACFDLIKALTGLKDSNQLENYGNSIPKRTVYLLCTVCSYKKEQAGQLYILENLLAGMLI